MTAIGDERALNSRFSVIRVEPPRQIFNAKFFRDNQDFRDRRMLIIISYLFKIVDVLILLMKSEMYKSFDKFREVETEDINTQSIHYRLCLLLANVTRARVRAR